ncbi:hypothetical protein NDU88_005195, partial [Pleurodeles waltl]
HVKVPGCVTGRAVHCTSAAVPRVRYSASPTGGPACDCNHDTKTALPTFLLGFCSKRGTCTEIAW